MLIYKVLLVDDEEEVMDMIERRISWPELGFEVVGKAQNGIKALEISEKLQPDVVITDIKMPYMDGLELARNLKQDNPCVRILILTGFDEFEYAKEAVRLEIDEYILKPVNAIELSDCLKRLKNVLDREREEKLKEIYEGLEEIKENWSSIIRSPFLSCRLIFSARLWKDRSPVGKYTNIFVTIRYRCRDHITAVQSCIPRKTIFQMGCPRSFSPCLSKGRHGKDSVTDGIADFLHILAI